MGKLTERVVKQLEKKGHKVKPRWDRTWFLTKIQDLRITASSIMKDRENLRGKSIIGRFFFFYYDAKTKEKLKYWDKFPLTIPIEMYDDGFLGLNFHYVAPSVRIKLLSLLMQYATTNKLEEHTRIRLSYPIIKQTAALYKATPCIKRYLWSHVKSRFLELDATDWNAAMQLPLQQFQKSSEQQVWADSAAQGRN